MTNEKASRLSVLDVVALLADLPAAGLARGQVGTVVEMVGRDTVLVEFSDDEGRAYAIVPCPIPDLLVLHYVPEAVA
jgi:catabolite regulation protein CreA